MTFNIHNALLYTGDQILPDHTVRIENDCIHSFFPSTGLQKQANDLDLKGAYLAPAFVDAQLYGASGKLFNNSQDLEALHATHALNLKGGTTRYVITLSTNSREATFQAVDIARRGLDQKLPGLLGLHLEGPFLNVEKRGAHVAEWVLKPTLEKVREIIEYGKGVLKMMTIAPEVFDSETLQYLHHSGVLISAGHSNASYEQAMTGFNSGIQAVTHLYNAMSQFGSREPGLLGAAMNHHSVQASIIPDGIHCSFKSLQIAKKIMGRRLFLITDSVTDSPDGPYKFVKGDNQYLNDKGTLAGSAISMIQGIKNCVNFAGISLEEALRMASAYPAALLNQEPVCGIIRPGAVADLVAFDSSFEVLNVFYEGKPQAI